MRPKILFAVLFLFASLAAAQDAVKTDPAKEKSAAADVGDKGGGDKGSQAENSTEPAKPTLPGFTRLSKDHPLWIHPKRKLVVVEGEVSMTRGPLEMFACPKGTKEHESVVAVHSPAQYVHAALLAIGARMGSPVKFDPVYKPATGQIIDVYVLWVDKEGKKRTVKAQEWIRETKSQKALKTPFVFAGSGFWVDESNGKRYYHGDGGDFICVSNFPSATLDLPVESSQSNEALMYDAFEGRIPARGTRIRLVLAPRPEKKKPVEVGRRPAPAEKR